MKKIICLFVGYVISTLTIAQTNVFPGSGNAGIGTTSPDENLEIVGSKPVIKLRNTVDGVSASAWLQFNDVNSRMGIVGFGSSSNNNFYVSNEAGGNIIMPSGNIGIGTFSPTGRLSIDAKQSTLTDILDIKGTSSRQWSISYEQNSWLQSKLSFDEFDANGSRFPRLTLNTGKVGIGTTTPDEALEIYSTRPVMRLKNSADGSSAFAWLEYYDINSRMGYIGFGSSGNSNLYIQNEAGGNVIVPNGHVGIGTLHPDAELSVKGSIHTNEVKVDLNGAVAPDYVFDDNYDLRTLEETEKYIHANSHLPEIPSASEMEENGLNLKEMNLMLLKKVEELTLYMIEMNKDMKSHNDEIQQLKKENQDLKSKVSALSKE